MCIRNILQNVANVVNNNKIERICVNVYNFHSLGAPLSLVSFQLYVLTYLNVCRLSVDHVLVGEEHQADVGHHVDEVRREALVQPPDPLVLDDPLHAVPGARVPALRVLQSRPHYLQGHLYKLLRKNM